MNPTCSPANAPPPSTGEIERFLRNLVYNRIKQEYRDHTFLMLDSEENPTEMTIFPGTPESLTIRALPDGQLSMPAANLPNSVRDGNFSHHIKRLQLAISNSVHRSLREFLTGTPDERPPETAPPSPNCDTRELDETLASPEVARLTKSVTKALVNAAAKANVRNPEAYGNAVLHRVTGTKTISFVLTTAGVHATWQDYNTCVVNRAEIETAYAQNPNATLLWFALTRESGSHHPDQNNIPGDDSPQAQLDGPRVQRPTRPLHTTATEILAQAETLFAEYHGHTVSNPLNKQDREAAAARLPLLWNTFRSLNNLALRQKPAFPYGAIALANLVTAARVQPSYTGAHTFLKHHFHAATELPHRLTEAFLTESARRRNGQRALATQYESLLSVLRSKDHPQRHPLKQVLETAAGTPGRTPWQTWIKAAAPYVTQEEPKRSKPARERQPTAAATRPTLEAIQHALAGPAGDQALTALKGALTLTVKPHEAITLSTNEGPFLELMMEPNGRIAITAAPSYWTALPVLPSPQGQHPTNINSRGLAGEAATNAVWNALRDHDQLPQHDNPPTLRNIVATAAQNLLIEAPAELRLPLDDVRLSEQILQALRAMLSQETWERAQQLGGPVTVSQYNLAVTNPGALSAAPGD